jgi:F-type H+-transporting ATPase subunit c
MNILNNLAEITGSFHIGMAALASALAVGVIGYKASEAVGRNPGAATPILIQAILSSALAEGIVFFAIFLAK